MFKYRVRVRRGGLVPEAQLVVTGKRKKIPNFARAVGKHGGEKVAGNISYILLVNKQ